MTFVLAVIKPSLWQPVYACHIACARELSPRKRHLTLINIDNIINTVVRDAMKGYFCSLIKVIVSILTENTELSKWDQRVILKLPKQSYLLEKNHLLDWIIFADN